MKCFSLRMTRFRRRSCLILVPVGILTFINILFMWKDIYWQDKEFELNTLGLPNLTRKRRSLNHTLFAKSWQSRATPDIFHYSILQRTTRKSGPKSTRKAIHYSTILAQREKKLTPVYHTILRKQDRTPDAKQDKQFVATTERLPTQKRVNKEVRELAQSLDRSCRFVTSGVTSGGTEQRVEGNVYAHAPRKPIRND